GLRIQFFWRLAGLPAAVEDNYLRKHRGELNWIRTAIRICWSLQGGELESVCGPRDSDELRRRLELAGAHWVDDQHAYFVRRAERATHRKERLEWLVRCGMIVGLVASVVIGALLLVPNPARELLHEWVEHNRWSEAAAKLLIGLALVGAALLHRYMD